MCCFKIFRLASEYIRHADKHKDASDTKMTYINKTCDELRERVARELDHSLAKSKCVPEGVESRSKKRALGPAGMDSNTSEAQRVKLDGVDAAATDHSHLQHVNGIDPSSIASTTSTRLTLIKVQLQFFPPRSRLQRSRHIQVCLKLWPWAASLILLLNYFIIIL